MGMWRGKAEEGGEREGDRPWRRFVAFFPSFTLHFALLRRQLFYRQCVQDMETAVASFGLDVLCV